jgi:hypothetical protein
MSGEFPHLPSANAASTATLSTLQGSMSLGTPFFITNGPASFIMTPNAK